MEIVRYSDHSDRYKYDFNLCTPKLGWAQVDTSQDASYFGTWANPQYLRIVTYCEGDVILEIAANEYEFVKALREKAEWNFKQGFRFMGIDPMCGEAIEKRFRNLGLADLLDYYIKHVPYGGPPC